MAHVLIVEDYEDLSEGLRASVCAYGHHAIVARSGQEALAILKRVQPDVALIDWHLPDRCGKVIARQIREVHPSCCIVLMTSFPDALLDPPEVFDRVLPKPFTPEQFGSVLGCSGRDLLA